MSSPSRGFGAVETASATSVLLDLEHGESFGVRDQHDVIRTTHILKRAEQCWSTFKFYVAARQHFDSWVPPPESLRCRVTKRQSTHPCAKDSPAGVTIHVGKCGLAQVFVFIFCR